MESVFIRGKEKSACQGSRDSSAFRVFFMTFQYKMLKLELNQSSNLLLA